MSLMGYTHCKHQFYLVRLVGRLLTNSCAGMPLSYINLIRSLPDNRAIAYDGLPWTFAGRYSEHPATETTKMLI